MHLALAFIPFQAYQESYRCTHVCSFYSFSYFFLTLQDVRCLWLLDTRNESVKFCRNAAFSCVSCSHHFVVRFSPDPSLTWSKLNGSMPMGRYELQNYNSKFHITNVKQLDEGDYKCRGANSANGGSFTHEIFQIDVQCEHYLLWFICSQVSIKSILIRVSNVKIN